MSGFKFCFSVDEEYPSDIKREETTKKCDETKHLESEESKSITEWFEAAEIFPSQKIIDSIDDIVLKANMFVCGDLEIGHVFSETAITYLKEHESSNLGDNVFLAESQDSDLLAGKYEGGLKVWECTEDLVRYLSEEKIIKWEGTKVLDLGCGAGILGIMALLSEAEVHFQDYNREVIIAATIPNVLLNIGEDERELIKTKCKFFSGDWDSLDKLMEADADAYKYDYILSSETIYNVENHQKLYDIIKNRLKNGGTAFVAAKTYYFGVGGGVKQFEALVNKDDKMTFEICWNSIGGVCREIIKLTFK